MSVIQAKKVLKIEAEGIAALCERIGPEFDMAVDLVMRCSSRLVITGIGKSGIIGQKIAATLNSTGTSSFYLHPVEAMHGDLGRVDERDLVLAISYSGKTAELNMLMPSLKKRGIKIIAMTGDPDSALAGFADVVLNVAVPREACPLGLAPTASTTAALAMGDALAVVLLERKHFNESDFRRNHPGGSLGERLRVKVCEVMLTGKRVPLVLTDTPLRRAVEVLNEKNLGAILVAEEHSKVIGVITDGDIRRLLVKNPGLDLDGQQAGEVMTLNPKTIRQDLLAADALSIMQRHEITVLPVIDDNDLLAGFLHLHDLLGKGEFRFLV